MNVKYKKESSYQFEYQIVKLNMIAGQNICYCQYLAFFFLVKGRIISTWDNKGRKEERGIRNRN